MALVHWHYEVLGKTISIKGTITVPAEIMPFAGMLFYIETKTYRIETQPIFRSYERDLRYCIQSKSPAGSWSFEVEEV